MLSKAKVQGAEPLALLMVGSMERGTYVHIYARIHFVAVILYT